MAKSSSKKTKTARSAELDLLESIDRLTRKINELIDLFSAANLQMEQQDIDTELISKLNNIVEQNEKIAEGILAVADMAKDIKDLLEKDEKYEDEMFDKIIHNQQLFEPKHVENYNYPYAPEAIPAPQPFQNYNNPGQGQTGQANNYSQQQSKNIDFPKPPQQERPSINPFESNIFNSQRNSHPDSMQQNNAKINNIFSQSPGESSLPPKISDDVLGLNPIQQNTAPKPLSFDEKKEKNDKDIFS